MDWRFTTILLFVSALTAAAVLSLRDGLDHGGLALAALGVALALLALLGVVVLVRIVVLQERQRRIR